MTTLLCAIVELETGKYIAAGINTVVDFSSVDSPQDQGIYKDRRYFYVSIEEESKLGFANVSSDLEKLTARSLEELHTKLDMSGTYVLSDIHEKQSKPRIGSIERNYTDADLPTYTAPKEGESKPSRFRTRLRDFRRDYDID